MKGCNKMVNGAKTAQARAREKGLAEAKRKLEDAGQGDNDNGSVAAPQSVDAEDTSGPKNPSSSGRLANLAEWTMHLQVSDVRSGFVRAPNLTTMDID
jgi:hypothetical protein